MEMETEDGSGKEPSGGGGGGGECLISACPGEWAWLFTSKEEP